MGPVEINFTAKDHKEAAKMQQQFLSQMEMLGYRFNEFKAISNKNKVEATLTLVWRSKTRKTAP